MAARLQREHIRNGSVVPQGNGVEAIMVRPAHIRQAHCNERLRLQEFTQGDRTLITHFPGHLEVNLVPQEFKFTLVYGDEPLVVDENALQLLQHKVAESCGGRLKVHHRDAGSCGESALKPLRDAPVQGETVPRIRLY
jgi:hypothetical protein